MAGNGKKAQGDNPHAGHRIRMKERFAKTGFDGFASHEVLEMLLYYAIPQGDTNYLAHDLLDRYGSLRGVLQAEPHDLMEVKGIGVHTASLIKVISAFNAYVQQESASIAPINFSSKKQMRSYVASLFVNCELEKFYVISLNPQNDLIMAEKVAEGTPHEVHVAISSIVASAMRHKAKSIILAHNHPKGPFKPSSSDVDITMKALAATKHLGIALFDHLIVWDNEVFSFYEHGMMQFSILDK